MSYNETILGRTLTDKEARKAGISLAHIARNREIEPGKVDHPVWKQVNTWPKWMLDKYYAKSLAKKPNEPDSDGSGYDAPSLTRPESTLARNEAGAGKTKITLEDSIGKAPGLTHAVSLKSPSVNITLRQLLGKSNSIFSFAGNRQ